MFEEILDMVLPILVALVAALAGWGIKLLREVVAKTETKVDDELYEAVLGAARTANDEQLPRIKTAAAEAAFSANSVQTEALKGDS